MLNCAKLQSLKSFSALKWSLLIHILVVVLSVCYQARSSESDNDHLAELQACPGIFAAVYLPENVSKPDRYMLSACIKAVDAVYYCT